jgi:hypothetical protein
MTNPRMTNHDFESESSRLKPYIVGVAESQEW